MKRDPHPLHYCDSRLIRYNERPTNLQGELVTTILEEAIHIVAARERAYHEIQVDFYFMALISRDRDLINRTWQEALADDHYQLMLLLIETRRQYQEMYHRPESPFRRHQRTSARASKRQHQRPSARRRDKP